MIVRGGERRRPRRRILLTRAGYDEVGRLLTKQNEDEPGNNKIS